MVDTVAVIQSTLAPIFLVSGAAIFLNFTQARLFRVVDRLRAIGASLATQDDPAERRHLLAHRGRNLTRALILRNSVLFGVLVIAFTVVTTLLILIPTAFFGHDAGTLAIAAFAAALVSFAVALVLVTIDAFLSVAAVRSAGVEFREGVRPGEDS